MRTDELIVALARDAGPVRPLAPPVVRLAMWLVVSATVGAAAIVIIGARPDLSVAARNASFDVSLGLLVTTAGLACLASLVIAIPGARGAGLRYVPLLTAGVWVLGWASLLLSDSTPAASTTGWFWAMCIAKVSAIAAVPALVLVAMLRRAAPLQAPWAAALAGLASLAASAAAVQLVCPIDAPAHVLPGHAAPVALFSAIAGAMHASLLPQRGFATHRRKGSQARPLHRRPWRTSDRTK